MAALPGTRRLAGSFPGSAGPVSLSAYQRALLNGMDRALEACDPQLASRFAIFTALTSGEGPPRTERLARAPNPVLARLRASIRWARASAAVPIVLVVSLMAAIIALGMATSGGRACPPGTATHRAGPARSAACPSSANG
jgi:hypothetical protein